MQIISKWLFVVGAMVEVEWRKTEQINLVNSDHYGVFSGKMKYLPKLMMLTEVCDRSVRRPSVIEVGWIRKGKEFCRLCAD